MTVHGAPSRLPRDLHRLPVAACQKGDEVRIDDLADGVTPGLARIRKITNSTPRAGLVTWHTTKGDFELPANLIVRVVFNEYD